MGSYADLKTKKLIAILEWLKNNSGVEIRKGGKHQIRVASIYTGEVYPLPTSHKTINKYIIKDFVKFLVRNKICTKKKFDEKL